MGFGTYERHDGRMGGYNVQAVCDLPGCETQIDRGMSYLCGYGPDHDGDWSCGGCFCSDHLLSSATDDAPSLCPDCTKAQELVLNSQVDELLAGIVWLLEAAGITGPDKLPEPPRFSYSSQWRPCPFDLIGEAESLVPEDRLKVLQDEAGAMYDMIGDLQTFVPDERRSTEFYRLSEFRREMIDTANETAYGLQRARAEAAKATT